MPALISPCKLRGAWALCALLLINSFACIPVKKENRAPSSAESGVENIRTRDVAAAVNSKFNLAQLKKIIVGEHLPGNTFWKTSVVKYLTPDEAQRCKLVFKKGLIYEHDGITLFDTSNAKMLLPSGAENSFEKGKAIYVMNEAGEIFASNLQHRGVFHHSSLVAGNPVAAAGEIFVHKGKLVKLNNSSGHCSPDKELNKQIFVQLKSKGIDIDNVEYNWVGKGPVLDPL